MPGDSLVDQRSWLQAVLDLSPFAALLIEPGTGRVRFANRAASRLPFATADPGPDPLADGRGHAHGAPGSFAAYDDRGERLAPEDWPRRRAARGETLDGVPVSWRFAEGELSFLAFAGTLPALHGQPHVALLTLLDVTRLKATERELQRAVEARDELVSVATHELKDPLASLLLSIEVLKRLAGKHESLPGALLTQQLEVSKRQGDRLARMIENLLDVSRIASGRSRLDVEAFDLCELLHDLVGRFQEQARAAGTPLSVAPCDPTIGYFDRMKLEHAIGNLLSNAIKYGAGRPVTVRLEADPSTVRVAVEDRGVGIAEADQARIFERFERASEGHKEQSLGLGLYIVRSTIEAHGGTIRVRSAAGRGATFTIELPRKRVPRLDPSSPSAGTESESAPATAPGH